MSLVEYAEQELRTAGLFDKDSDYGGMLGEAVLALIKAFADQGHSGFSASMAVSMFEKLARFKPLSPLTGEDHEWEEVGPGVWQNKRCFHVFKENGGAYDAEGKVFREPDGCCYTDANSRVPITFPYTPKAEYVAVPATNSKEP